MPDQPRSPGAGATGPLVSHFADDPEMVELIQEFVRDLNLRVRSLETDWRSRSFEEIRRTAHQLKGASGGYGFSELGEVAGRLETALVHLRANGDEQGLESVRAGVEELISMCKRVRVR